MRKAQLTIIHFFELSDCNTLKNILCSAGYAVELYSGRELLQQRDLFASDSVIIFLSAAVNPTDPIIAAIRKISSRFILCVIEGSPSKWDPDIIDCCDEFIHWPCHIEEIELRMGRLLGISTPAKNRLEDKAFIDEFCKLNLVGESPRFIKTLKIIKKVARCNAPVLIEGETGTGKEIAARAVHYLGARQDFPFIPVNCGALPDNLIENELFGHVKGAYTDAKSNQTGLIAQAEGGTFFLDEINSLSTKGQVALLRFLQDQQYMPLGGDVIKKANVRIIVSTNMRLEKMVESGSFRSDLFFRLNILSINMPPLRERCEDVELLAEHFLRQYCLQYRQSNKRLNARSLQWLKNRDWPGNVRELENMIHRVFLFTEGETIRLGSSYDLVHDEYLEMSDLNHESTLDMGFNQAKANAIESFEQSYLRQLMSQSQGNISLAAKRTGKERRALGKLLKKHGIKKEPYVGKH